MPSFRGINNPDIVITVSDCDEVHVCPKCTFPNDAAARACVDCGHPLQDGSGRWVPARLIQKCSNPACGAFVCTKDGKCKKCGHSTSDNVRAVPSPSPPASTSVTGADTSFVLVCPRCNARNPANADSCERCGYSLEDVDPVCESEKKSLVVQLENIRTQRRVAITLTCGESTAVGRCGVLADQLVNADFVGRKHLYLSYNEGTVWVRDNKSVNGTYLNGADVRLDSDVDYPISGNTIIGLGDSSVSTSHAAFFKIIF